MSPRMALLKDRARGEQEDPVRGGPGTFESGMWHKSLRLKTNSISESRQALAGGICCGSSTARPGLSHAVGPPARQRTRAMTHESYQRLEGDSGP